MKKTIFFLAATLIISCSSFPKPEKDSDSLVIGSAIWEFPDRFFNKPPRRFITGITLGVVNLTNGKQFRIRTDNGYYFFKTNGTDKYMLQYVELKDLVPGENFSLNYRLNLQIINKPRSVIYSGELKITFASPEKADTKIRDDMIWFYYKFREKHEIIYKPEELSNHLAQTKDNPWADYEIIKLFEL